MTRAIRQYVVLYILLFFAVAATPAFASRPMTIDVAVGYNKPPYIISDEDSGFELSLVESIFNQQGYAVQWVYVPIGRTSLLLLAGQVDVGLTLNHRHGINPSWLSEPYITYQNVAVSLQSRQINIEGISDLERYSVVAFQSASTLLGDEYALAASQRKDYLELPEQENQVNLLLKGSVDVAVMDINIFNHFKTHAPSPLQQKRVVIHPIFPPSIYRAGIRDTKLRDAFNQGLRHVIQDGTYERLLEQFNLTSKLFLIEPEAE
ncbi:substrate-binding periplasmic protein [Alteromonas oceanisediminis]|uniref:substrate-binding periplasmic protein n=1 Tax=Alteromonas oceanisediminis TaxID=2836180 RepID=UPI001BDB4478|nr:transporter substrate-binding domain-containing protein [Alteromonas oceanisediminis]MBT0586238.1 transporter substrate-binding domain-containing protein [Alteromonas oceanisediminis]